MFRPREDISIEWLFMAIFFLSSALVVSYLAPPIPINASLCCMIPVFLVVYLYLILGGRTAEGVVWPSSQAARGHPYLSLVVAFVVTLLVIRVSALQLLGLDG